MQTLCSQNEIGNLPNQKCPGLENVNSIIEIENHVVLTFDPLVRADTGSCQVQVECRKVKGQLPLRDPSPSPGSWPCAAIEHTAPSPVWTSQRNMEGRGPSMVGHLRDSLLESSLAIRSSQGGAGTQTINFSHLSKSWRREPGPHDSKRCQ